MARPAVVVQWNNQSVRRHKFDLIFLLQKYSPTVAAVSETWLRPGNQFRVPGFICLRDRSVMDTAVLMCLLEIILPFPRPHFLSQAMLSLVDDMFPLKKHSVVGISSPPWWDQEYTRAVRREEELKFYTVETCPRKTLSTFLSLDALFSVCELNLVLSSLKDSAPGIDGIPYCFLINASEQKNTDYNPNIKKQTESRRPCLHIARLFCPLLWQILLNTFVKKRLEWNGKSRSLLANFQYGFRKDRSTIDSLSIFTSDIRVSLFQRKSVTATVLYVSSAYDNVQLPILITSFISRRC
ncbi:hypothetical protein EVAR_12028_1 [Eumeta japonica]|uniref:Reverse transcriptase domain-containing protein n=1 Tax=Eumeta variegata TaxID=151549 RepID=A0A4C1U5N4_EUMVA|nr:hypothetical protein EVAR_12028_1 [Eumeta japonica]